MPTIHLLIKGKVQGVFYRVRAREKAGALGLTGWIRNSSEGNVEAMVTGEAAQLASFEMWCRRGPADALVGEVVVTAHRETMFDGFIIKR